MPLRTTEGCETGQWCNQMMNKSLKEYLKRNLSWNTSLARRMRPWEDGKVQEGVCFFCSGNQSTDFPTLFSTVQPRMWVGARAHQSLFGFSTTLYTLLRLENCWSNQYHWCFVFLTGICSNCIEKKRLIRKQWFRLTLNYIKLLT